MPLQNVPKSPENSTFGALLHVPRSSTIYTTRAKFIPQRGGGLRLAQIQSFSVPKFRPSGWDDEETESALLAADEASERSSGDADTAANIQRASRRAKTRALDAILCNPDLDTFATFTFAPDPDLDKSAYDQTYDILKPWLSNRVQRNDLKYIVVPELHKSGDVHFHGVMNSQALKLEQAFYPDSGRAILHNGKKVFNVIDWRAGFTTAQIIGRSDTDRDKVAKYVFKYMGKQLGARIGGRYALMGGALERPVYYYSNNPAYFFNGNSPVYQRDVEIGSDLTYREWSFV